MSGAGRALLVTGVIGWAAGSVIAALYEADLSGYLHLVARTDTRGLVEAFAVAGMIEELAMILLGIGWLLLHIGGKTLPGGAGSAPGRALGASAGAVAAGASGIELWATAQVWGSLANPGPYDVGARLAVAAAVVMAGVGWYLERRRPA